MNTKEDLIQDGYELLGKYNEELLSYIKLSVVNDVPGVSYYFVDNAGNVVGGKKFFSKKDISLAVNIQEKIASKQRGVFKTKPNKPGKAKKRRTTKPKNDNTTQTAEVQVKRSAPGKFKPYHK